MAATVSVRQAFPDDFERVYPLLHGFGGAPIPRERWRRIFVPPFPSGEEFCGYLLVRDGEVAGYLGTIFSRRRVNGRVEPFCNMTSWIVREDCRGHSLSMLRELLALRDHTVTNFTASPTVARILARLGFRDFALDQRVLLPLPALSRRRHGCDLDPTVVGKQLSGTDRRIFDDHLGLGCDHLLLRSGSGQCYVLLTRTVRRHVPLAKVHYLSDAAVFHECMETLTAGLCLRLRVAGVMVDERYLEGRSFRASVSYPHQRRAYFKSDTVTDPRRLDTLYSELVILQH